MPISMIHRRHVGCGAGVATLMVKAALAGSAASVGPRLVAIVFLVIASLLSGRAAAASGESVCTSVLAGEFADAPRSSAAPPRRPELNLAASGRYCLEEDVRQEKLLDHRGRELAARGGDAIVLVGADDIHLDLGGHTVANAREPGYTLVRHDRHVPGRVQSHWFAGTVVRNGYLVSPGGAGTAIRLVSAQRYAPQGFGEPAALVPGQSLDDVFRRTRHRLEHLTIAAGRRAILIDGRDNVIRHNRIVVDGYTAIVAQGPGVVIEDNLIEVRGDLSGLSAQERAADGAHPFVIRLIQADGAVVRNNRVRLTGGTPPLAAAIELTASRAVTLEENRLDGFARAVQADTRSDYMASANLVRPCWPRGTRLVAPLEGGAGRVSAEQVGCQ